MPDRFAILHHQTADGEHWDLMLERGDVLWSWRLEREPRGGESLPIAAERIGDHRLAYLGYEGPISRDRGMVRNVDTGTVVFVEITAQKCTVELSGRRLAGRFLLPLEGKAWFSDADSDPPESP